jgi:hypothetical protein
MPGQGPSGTKPCGFRTQLLAFTFLPDPVELVASTHGVYASLCCHWPSTIKPHTAVSEHGPLSGRFRAESVARGRGGLPRSRLGNGLDPQRPSCQAGVRAARRFAMPCLGDPRCFLCLIFRLDGWTCLGRGWAGSAYPPCATPRPRRSCRTSKLSFPSCRCRVRQSTASRPVLNFFSFCQLSPLLSVPIHHSPARCPRRTPMTRHGGRRRSL